MVAVLHPSPERLAIYAWELRRLPDDCVRGYAQGERLILGQLGLLAPADLSSLAFLLLLPSRFKPLFLVLATLAVDCLCAMYNSGQLLTCLFWLPR